MSILATKLYIPPSRPQVVSRSRLIERLNEGLHRKLILISAPAGFGKTTLVSEWVLRGKLLTGWLSLEQGENDPARFLMYLIAALQTIIPTFGEKVSGVLQSSQPPPIEAILTTLLNDLSTIKDHFFLVLDDYHVLDAKAVDQALVFLLDHLPPHMHLVISTREDPRLPLARLRARGHLTEVRAGHLRFTPLEATTFLNQVMALNLSAEDITRLSRRTEGWIAGLQLAALSLQGHLDATNFITSFTGSHHFVLDYLVEEVLGQQSERIQMFLLRTSILDRMSGLLCDAILLDSSASGQATLEYLERSNLFIVPLDNERRWYRYHHLFTDLLRLRLRQSITSSPGQENKSLAELHIRASQWYEDHGLELEAFHHATAAQDVECAARLMEGKGMPLHVRGTVASALNFLESLPKVNLDARPSLWVRYASLLLRNGQATNVEEKLQAAEAAVSRSELDDQARNLLGEIAVARANLALTRYQSEPMLTQSRRALQYLHPNNLTSRTTAHWTLGVASFLQGDRAAARQAYTQAIALSQAAGQSFSTTLATLGLGNIQEADNQLYLAAETYRSVLQLLGDQPLPLAGEAHLALARICYEWNDLEAALAHGHQSLQLARQFDRAIDRFVLCEVLLARLSLAQNDVAGATMLLADASQSARQHHFVDRLPEVAAAQVLMLLRQGSLSAAAHLAQAHNLPISQARVHLAQSDPSAALAVLSPWREQMEARGWKDEQLKVMVLQAVALQAHNEQEKAVQLLCDALSLAEPSGFIRLFVDEGKPMAHLLSQVAALGMMPDYLGKLLAAWKAEERKSVNTSHEVDEQKSEGTFSSPLAQPLLEPLSQREAEILHLIAQGRSNQQISEQLFLALSTVKGHNRNIFGKLGVQRRTEAIARARQLGLL